MFSEEEPEKGDKGMMSEVSFESSRPTTYEEDDDDDEIVYSADNDNETVVGSTDEVLEAGFVIEEDGPEDIMDVFDGLEADDNEE